MIPATFSPSAVALAAELQVAQNRLDEAQNSSQTILASIVEGINQLDELPATIGRLTAETEALSNRLASQLAAEIRAAGRPPA